jgi:uncharacterized protein with ParB-like and HNH nuclease domain
MELKKVQEIFNQNRFIIPNYQRGYAWEYDQINDFISDIKDVADLDEHYTGQIIVASKQQQTIGTVSYDVYEVVDGQQRLTTISIYILCVCNRLRKLGQDPERILDSVIYKEIPILKLNDDNDQFYRDEILSPNTTLEPRYDNKSQRNLFNAKKQITNYLEVYKNKDRLLVDYKNLMHKFRVNFSVLTSHLEAGLVFETMNDRGIPLNQMDKVKNYLIYLCSRLKDKKLANIISLNYGKIFSELMRIEGANISKTERTEKIEDDFLSCSYFLFNGKNFKDSVHQHIKTEFLPKREVIKRTKQVEMNFTNDEVLSNQHKNIKKLAEFLGESAKVYASIFNCQFKTEQINEYLKRINFLGATDKHSRLLLSLFIHKNEENLSSVLEMLEILIFRCKKQPNTNELALDIRKSPKEYSVKKIKDELRIIIQRHCPEKSFVDMLRSNDFYDDTKGNNKAIYLLYEYEMFLCKEKSTDSCLPNFDTFCRQNFKRFEIEHIDPQQPHGRKPLESVNQLGNLTATFSNKTLNNKEFADKKSIFKQSQLNVEKQLMAFDKWDEQAIKKRTDELVKFAKKRWGI